MQSLEEQFITILTDLELESHKRNNILQPIFVAKTNAYVKAQELKLKNVQCGFVLTASQFNYLSEIFNKYEAPGLWIL